MVTSEIDVNALPLEEEVRMVLIETLQVSDSERIHMNTELLGSMPEFDSMAVVTVLTAFEERFGIEIDDEEISADIFATVSTVIEFLAGKLDP